MSSTIRVLGTVEKAGVDHVVIGGSSRLLSINTKAESVDIWALSDTGIIHTCPLIDPTSSRRSIWSCTEHHTAPFLDEERMLVFAMSPQVLNQRDTVRIFRLQDDQLAPCTSVRLSSEMPVNIYRYSLQPNGHLLIAANEGEDHEGAEYDEEDEGVVARILVCDPTVEDLPIQRQIAWPRLHDPFFDSIFLLPSGTIVATESHHHMGHGEIGVAIHLWDSSSNAEPSRTIQTFPTLIQVDVDVYLTVEITASIITSTLLILCAVENIMDLPPHSTSHQSSIRAFGIEELKEEWCAEPILGSIRALHYIKSQGVIIAFGSINESSSGGPDWALTVTAIDAISGDIKRAERLNYKGFWTSEARLRRGHGKLRANNEHHVRRRLD